MKDFAGQVAVITGAGGGLGRAHAHALAKRGVKIVVNDLGNAAGVVDEITAAGGEAVADSTDISDRAAAAAMVEDTVARWGRIDILVNNAGIIRRDDAVDFTEADWDAVMDVNLKAVFFTCQAFARAAIPRGRGKIVNIASLLSFQGGIRVPSYTASKHGVAGLTKLLANEWAAKGLNVNAIAPGYIETNNTEALRADPDRSRAILERIPAGRWGRPEDIGQSAVYLAAPASDYVNGAVLNVDGGWLAR